MTAIARCLPVPPRYRIGARRDGDYRRCRQSSGDVETTGGGELYLERHGQSKSEVHESHRWQDSHGGGRVRKVCRGVAFDK
jgi:hypothetical protein